jgi:hypothetical protein
LGLQYRKATLVQKKLQQKKEILDKKSNWLGLMVIGNLK